MDREEFVTTTWIAGRLGVQRQTVSRWIREGRMPARRIQSGDRVIYRIRYVDFVEFVRRYVRDE